VLKLTVFQNLRWTVAHLITQLAPPMVVWAAAPVAASVVEAAVDWAAARAALIIDAWPCSGGGELNLLYLSSVCTLFNNAVHYTCTTQRAIYIVADDVSVVVCTVLVASNFVCSSSDMIK
jgi:hypothetical protein